MIWRGGVSSANYLIDPKPSTQVAYNTLYVGDYSIYYNIIIVSVILVFVCVLLQFVWFAGWLTIMNRDSLLLSLSLSLSLSPVLFSLSVVVYNNIGVYISISIISLSVLVYIPICVSITIFHFSSGRRLCCLLK